MIATKMAPVANNKFQKLASNRAGFRQTTPTTSNTKAINAIAITK